MSDAARYAREKPQAVDTLVTGSGRVLERLGAGAIKLLPARPEDIPYDDLRRTFVGVIDDLTYAKAKDDEGRSRNAETHQRRRCSCYNPVASSTYTSISMND